MARRRRFRTTLPLGSCVTCHDEDGAQIDGVGVAPASPHGEAAAAGAMQRCRQCHVPVETVALFVASRFTGLPQGPWKGGRATPGAPPTIPHTLQLRENCLACHAGPAARAEIRTSHPERVRCRQCHVPDAFARSLTWRRPSFIRASPALGEPWRRWPGRYRARNTEPTASRSRVVRCVGSAVHGSSGHGCLG